MDNRNTNNCELYDRKCIDCGECDICDLDSAKRCDDCGDCINEAVSFRTLDVGKFFKEQQKNSDSDFSIKINREKGKVYKEK